VVPIDDAKRAREASLLARAQRGEDAAFEQLVRPHLSMMRRVANRMGSAVLAEDVVQEALLIASQRLSDYQAGTRLGSWLAAIVSRRAVTLSRGQFRRARREATAASTGELPATPEQLVRGLQASERVAAALQSLPAKRREAAILRFDAAMSYAEIAQALDTSEASCRVLVYLAVKALKSELSDLLSENK